MTSPAASDRHLSKFEKRPKMSPPTAGFESNFSGAAFCLPHQMVGILFLYFICAFPCVSICVLSSVIKEMIDWLVGWVESHANPTTTSQYLTAYVPDAVSPWFQRQDMTTAQLQTPVCSGRIGSWVAGIEQENPTNCGIKAIWTNF